MQNSKKLFHLPGRERLASASFPALIDVSALSLIESSVSTEEIIEGRLICGRHCASACSHVVSASERRSLRDLGPGADRHPGGDQGRLQEAGPQAPPGQELLRQRGEVPGGLRGPRRPLRPGEEAPPRPPRWGASSRRGAAVRGGRGRAGLGVQAGGGPGDRGGGARGDGGGAGRPRQSARGSGGIDLGGISHL